LAWVALAALVTYALSVAFELHERYVGWVARYEHWEVDELPLTLAVIACGLAWVALRRRREAEAELQRREQAEAHVAALLAHNRALSQALIALQENERRALARELHDEFGQRCSAIRADAAWLRRCVDAGDDDRAGLLAAAERTDAAAADLAALVRDLLRRLRPADLDALGLVAALQALCEQWEERSGVACVFHPEAVDAVCDDAVNVTVYRVVQEALTNVLRHARASRVRVQLSGRDGDGLRLTIRDDGRGMDVGAPSRGLGLLGATERAAAVGGLLEVHSTLGQGVRIELHIPVASSPRQGWQEAA
jgi:two-component system sensor histidine kinase UhpB